MKFKFNYLIILSLLMLHTSCGFKITSSGANSGNIISGVISPLIGSIASHRPLYFISSAMAVTCSAPVYAKLFSLTTEGSIDETSPLATQQVGEDARYSFDTKTLAISKPTTNVQYLVKVEGCNSDIVYKRPVTDFDSKQDINAKTTVVAEVINANSLVSKKLNQADRKQVEILINSISGTTTSDALSSLTTDAGNATKFTEIFGATPDVIQSAKPEVNLIVPQLVLNELQISNFTLQTFHVDPNYSFAYKWKVDGVVKSSGPSFAYIPGGNDQGSHQIDLFVGKDDGNGSIDLSKPYYTKTILVAVNNNVLPVAPSISLNALTSSPRLSASLDLDIATGTNFLNCNTFSHFAITDTPTAPGIMQFTYACTTAIIQTETIALTAGEGSRSIYIWAMDSEGNVSTSNSIQFVLDTLVPATNLSMVGTSFRGGENKTLTLSASDDGTGLSSIKLYFSGDNGSTYTLVDNLLTTATSYTWSIPTLDTSAAKLKLSAIDNAGREGLSFTSSFTIDSTAPSAPALSRASAAVTNSSNVTMTVGSCSDTAAILITESNTAPSAQAPAWQACSTTNAAITSTMSGDGLHTFYAWAKDAVGNVATAANNISSRLDTTAPVIGSAPSIASVVAGGSLQNISWSVTDVTNILIGLEYFDGSSWNTIATGLNNSGSYNWNVANLNLANAQLRLTATDEAGNTSQCLSSNFVIDSSPPVLSSVIINDGASFAGTSIVSIKVGVADNFSINNQLWLRFSEANSGTQNCQSEFVNTGWESYQNATTPFLFSIVPFDGTKKVCVWAKDEVGNISVIQSPATGTLGVNVDTIEYQTGTPPSITAFNVTKSSGGGYLATSGDAITIDWSVVDVEELAGNPISFSYTTDNVNWKDIFTNLNISDSNNITWVGNLGVGVTNGAGSITNWTAPSSGYFRLKAKAIDVAGNTSNVVMSQPFNTGNWSVYAGNKDRGNGGTGKVASLFGSPRIQPFAINPKNGDVYAYDENVGIRKLDAKTGLVSTFIANGTLNLPVAGALPATPTMPISGYINPIFDSKGRLYLATNYSMSIVTIYQVDIENSYVRKYAGGGTADDGGALSTDLRVASSGMTFDEQDSLYLFTLTAVPTTTAEVVAFGKRIIKIAQNADGSPGATTRVIGNGAAGAITSGQLAVNQPASSTGNYTEYTGITAWDNGNKIYVQGYNSSIKYKIINGVVYSTNANATYVNGVSIYNPLDGYLYKTNNTGGLEKVLINTSGANGDVTTTIFNGNSSNPGCSEDGTDSSNYCGKIDYKLQIRSGI